MAHSKNNYTTAADVFDGWKDDVLTGTPPTFYPIGSGELARIEIGPGLVTLFGGAPGAGKTAFTMQAVTDALRLTPTLRALVCNVEMPARVLLDRQLARLSGIDLETIRYRRLTAEQPTGSTRRCTPWNRWPTGSPSSGRHSTWRTWPPVPTPSAPTYCCSTISSESRRPGNMPISGFPSTRRWITYDSSPTPGLPCWWWPPSAGRKKQGPNILCGRRFEPGIIPRIVGTGIRGRRCLYHGPGKRAGIWHRDGSRRHLKARHTQAKDLALEFDGRTQRFSEAEDPRTWKPDGGKPGPGKLQSALAGAWADTTRPPTMPTRGPNRGRRTATDCRRAGTTALHRLNGATPTRHQGNGKAKGPRVPPAGTQGRPLRRAQRLRRLHHKELTRAETGVWLLSGGIPSGTAPQRTRKPTGTPGRGERRHR